MGKCTSRQSPVSDPGFVCCLVLPMTNLSAINSNSTNLSYFSRESFPPYLHPLFLKPVEQDLFKQFYPVQIEFLSCSPLCRPEHQLPLILACQVENDILMPHLTIT